jgi:hypothetical protein
MPMTRAGTSATKGLGYVAVGDRVDGRMRFAWLSATVPAAGVIV